VCYKEKNHEKTVKTEYVYKGKILNLRNDEVVFPNGTKSQREIVEHNGGSCILCVEDDKILLVRQFRYALNKEIWEIPAGKLEKGEEPSLTAVRELEEECGYRAGEVKLLFTVYPTPGYDTETIYIYRAYNLKKTQTNFDEGEDIESRWFSFSEVKKMIDDGEINDGKTLIALLSVLK
jgi:ADP-ribose pyrophosphatase